LLVNRADWPSPVRHTATLFAFLLLFLIPLQALSATTQLTPMMDEGSHLASGYAYLITGRFRTGLDHPPLAKQLAALPLLIVKRQVPPDIREWNHLWQWPDQLATPGVDDIDGLFFWARLPSALLAMLLGWVVYRWTTALFGIAAGLLALFILAFDPTILAMGGLVNTDMALVAFVTLTLYRLWLLMRHPTHRNVLWAGLAFGLAQVSKFSALILVLFICALVFPMWLIPFLVRRQTDLPITRGETPALPAQLNWFMRRGLVIFAIGALVIWADYGFEVGPLDSLKRKEDIENLWLPNRVPEAYRDLVRNFPLPAPMYIKGLRYFFDHAQTGHPAFLAGQYSETGWWYYFPVAFLLKTPLPTMLLFSLGLFMSIRRYHEWYAKDLYLLLPIAIYAISSLFINVSIGYRHLLPLLTLLIILTGRAAELVQGPIWRAALVVFLCGWLLLESVNIWPDYLAYFNQLPGGPENGYRWLVDSNLDWGQDLRHLKTYMDQHGLQRVKLSYFGSVSPAFYGIEYDCLPSFGVQPRDGCPPWEEVKIEPGVYVISATNLQGVYLPHQDAFAWFRDQPPTARIGYSLFVYEVPP